MVFKRRPGGFFFSYWNSSPDDHELQASSHTSTNNESYFWIVT